MSGRGVGSCTAAGVAMRGNGDIVGEVTVVYAGVGVAVGCVGLSTGGLSGQVGGGLSEREQIPSRIQSA